MLSEPVYESLTCTIKDCASPLHLIWTTSAPLFTDICDDVPTPAEAYTRSWQVECEEGHIVLLPSDHGCCPCGVEACNGAEAGEGHDDFDCPGDDTRTFRKADAERLFRQSAT